MQVVPTVWVGKVTSIITPDDSRWRMPPTIPQVTISGVQWYMLKEPKGPGRKQGQLFGKLSKAEARGSKKGSKKFYITNLSCPSNEILAVFDRDMYKSSNDKGASLAHVPGQFSAKAITDIVYFAAVADRYKTYLQDKDQNRRFGPQPGND